MKVFDLHCDTLSELRYAEKAGTPKSFAQNDLHIDLQKLKKGDYMLQCFAAFVNLGDKTPGADPLVTALEEIDVFKRIMEKYPEDIAPVYQPSDIRKNAAEGKISGMLTIEEGGCCKGSLGVLRRMYELGVRMMTLTWNHENELASPNVVPGGGHNIWPCAPNTETGLKEKGFEFLAEMERLHIIADVSTCPTRLLGHCGALHPPLCGQPLQLPRPRTPLPQPHRRDDPRPRQQRRPRGSELLQRLPRQPARRKALPQHHGPDGKARGPLQAGGRH